MQTKEFESNLESKGLDRLRFELNREAKAAPDVLADQSADVGFTYHALHNLSTSNAPKEGKNLPLINGINKIQLDIASN